MKALAFHGYASSPSRIKWLTRALKELGLEVEAPKVPSPLTEAWKAFGDAEADLYAGHSMGGALALLLSSKFSKPAIAVAPPADLKYQMEYMKRHEKLRRVYEEIASKTDLEKMYELSPINYTYTAPILVIHGSEDDVVPLEESEELCELVESCKLVVVEGMGHSPSTEEHREKIKRAIEEFLAELQRTS